MQHELVDILSMLSCRHSSSVCSGSFRENTNRLFFFISEFDFCIISVCSPQTADVLTVQTLAVAST